VYELAARRRRAVLLTTLSVIFQKNIYIYIYAAEYFIA
jgi:hypothetical protein